MVYLFLGLGLVWGILGILQLIGSWGQTDGLKSALTFLLMAIFNVIIGWYLYRRKERRTNSNR